VLILIGRRLRAHDELGSHGPAVRAHGPVVALDEWSPGPVSQSSLMKRENSKALAGSQVDLRPGPFSGFHSIRLDLSEGLLRSEDGSRPRVSETDRSVEP
jgi:hypothetical protein